jgi:DNA topoisomerase-1
VEKNLRSGTYLWCPNNKKTAADEDAPKRRARKKKGDEPAEDAPAKKCDYSRLVAPPPPAEATQPQPGA